MLNYGCVVKENNRFMETNDSAEYRRWKDILDTNLIRYKVYAKEAGKHKLNIRFELIGYSKEENEKIRDLVGFYLDED